MKAFHLFLSLTLPLTIIAQDIEKKVEHGYANSGGVRIHYAALGERKNPLIVMIHGFPDCWYSWQEMMDSLSKKYYTVAIDQRGYNLSDKPRGEENYNYKFLVEDVAAVIHHLGFEKAIIIGHDFGGAVAWELGIRRPEIVERLVILNLPHPRGLRRELATNLTQQKNSEYARNMQKPDAYKMLTAEILAAAVVPNKQDNEKRIKYIEAFKRSDFEAMLNYYKQNYPKEPYTIDTTEVTKVKAPVLVIHGLDDKFLLPAALNNTWEWVENDLCIITIPGAGHFVHHDQPRMVVRSIKMWLER